MCVIKQIGNEIQPDKICIEYERDASMRATEVVIINKNRHGVEVEGLPLLCHDNGRITVRGGPVKLVDGEDIVTPGVYNG